MRLRFLWAIPWVLLGATSAAMAQADMSKIKILTEDYPPYSYKNEQGEVDGINTQKVKAALKKLNLNVPMEIQPWARAYQTAKEGENIFLFTASRTPERDKDFKWVTVLSKSDVSVYALKSKEFKIGSLDDLKKFKMSGVIGYRYLPFLTEKGFKTGDEGTIELTTNDESNFKKLMAERVDLMLSNSDQIGYFAKKLNVDASKLERVYEISPLLTEDYLVTGKKTSDEMIEKFRTGFQ